MKVSSNPVCHITSGRRLSDQMQAKHELNRLCAEAINRQIESGQVEATHLRNRRRHLARQILKRIPHASCLSPKRLLYAATMVLAIWGFSGIVALQQAEAAPVFKHNVLAGFGVGSYSKPTFADIDNDGDLDAFVGKRNGTVKFYRNTGTTAAPVFAADIAGNPLAGFDVGQHAAPTFADIDGDGDLDAFVGVGGFGVSSGTVKFYRNTQFDAVTPGTGFVADAAGNPLAGFDVGQYAVPTFADIDGDGDLDAFVGTRFGTVKFYRNNGSVAVPVFMADAAGNPLAPGGVPFDVGYFATPSFADIDGDGDLDAFVGVGGFGVSSGTVKFYRNTQFDAVTPGTGFVADAAGNPLAGFDVGQYAAPTFADIDGDGDLDAFVGGGSGTVKSYRNTQFDAVTPGTGFVADAAGNPLAGFDVGQYAAPTFADIDGDGDLDAFVGERNGTVKFYRNTQFDAVAPGTGFVADAAANPLAPSGIPFDVGYFATPSFADIDGDGDLDAFVGELNGTVKFYRNTQFDAVTPGAGFVADAAGNPLASVAVVYPAAPTFADIDGDGDLDAFVGEYYGRVKFYRNTQFDAVAPGTGFVADAAANPLAGVAVGYDSVPTFVDIDGDGDLDAFVGERYGTVKFYRNTQFDAVTPGAGFVADAAANPLAGFDMGYASAPTFADIDGDGDLDAFVGEKNGTVQFFENFDPSPVTVPDGLVATSGLPATTVDVTANDQFKTEGPAANFTITAFTQGASGAVTQVAGTNTFTYTSNGGFSGMDSFTYTLDDGAGNTATGTVNVTVNALPPGPVVLLGLNGMTFNSTTNNTMTLTATTVASNPPTLADVYIALQLPDGTLLVMQPDGSFSTTVTALVSNVPVPDFTGPIFSFTFIGAEPVGSYTWFAALTTPGTLNVIGTLAVAPFNFGP